MSRSLTAHTRNGKPSSRPGHSLPSKWWLVWSALFWALVALIMLWLTPVPGIVLVLAWAALTYATYRYSRDVRREQVGRDVGAWQACVQPDVDGMHISLRTFDELRYLLGVSEREQPDGEHYLVREDRVEWVTRYHWMKLLIRSGPKAAVSLLLLVALVTVIAVFSGPLLYGLTIVLSVALVYSALVTVMSYLRWHYSFLMVTNLNIWRITIKPVWLPYMESQQPSIPRRRVILSDPLDQGFLGNFFGYGILRLDTQAERDELYQHMRYLPLHGKIAEKVRRKM